MLRIKFFTCFSFPQGTYFRWHNLAIGLQRLGHEVTVHAIGASHCGRTQFEMRDGVRYVLVPTTPLLSRLLDHRLDLITLIRTIRHCLGPADVYHVFQPFPHSCLPALFHRGIAGCLLADWDDLWVGGAFANSRKIPSGQRILQRVVRALEERMPRIVDGVTTCSAFLADAARTRGASATQIIHNGYWPGQQLPSQDSARGILGLDPRAYYFGFMGRTLGELSWCLDSLAAKAPEMRTVRLALCGMRQSEIDELPPVQRASVDYLGNLTPAQTQVFARAIDCGLLPLEDTPFNQSRFPIKFSEYLAGGTHVIASAIGEFASLAGKLPGVTLAGKSRDAWRSTLGAIDLEQLDTNFPTAEDSMLGRTLGWQSLAGRLQDFYFAQLEQKPTVRQTQQQVFPAT